MDYSTLKLFFVLLQTLIILSQFSKASSDYNKLVLKNFPRLFSVDDKTLKHDLNIHKVCGQKAEGSGFEEQRDKAFTEMESGVITESNKGFYSGEHQSVHVMAQCEGDIEAFECGECVSIAVQIAQEECIDSISGQIYLDSCFISYSYYPHGSVPGYSDHKEKGSGSSTRKAVAIVLGGAAALGFGFIFLLLIKSCGKKDDCT